MVHINLIAITYLITDHDFDRLLDRDRLADGGSHGAVHINLIAITCLINDHDLDHLLIVIALLIADHMVCSTPI